MESDEHATAVGVHPRRRRWRRLVGLSVVGALLVGAVVVGVQEHRRPWYFYDWVGYRWESPTEVLHDYDALVDARQALAPLARAVASWDGVDRVEWPQVSTYDSNFGTIERPDATIVVHLDGDADSTRIGSRLEQIVHDAEVDGIDLRVVMKRGGQHVATCGVEFEELGYRCIPL